jgi:hypothetical protein
VSAGRHHRVRPGPVERPLSPALRSALTVLYHHGKGPMGARESNSSTAANAHGEPCIYWQSRAELERRGLIEAVSPPWYGLTELGRRTVQELGL